MSIVHPSIYETLKNMFLSRFLKLSTHLGCDKINKKNLKMLFLSFTIDKVLQCNNKQCYIVDNVMPLIHLTMVWPIYGQWYSEKPMPQKRLSLFFNYITYPQISVLCRKIYEYLLAKEPVYVRSKGQEDAKSFSQSINRLKNTLLFAVCFLYKKIYGNTRK
jgi:hypothetical protein